jgi:pimeloyl-ACP methyl ester carboxylesterase
MKKKKALLVLLILILFALILWRELRPVGTPLIIDQNGEKRPGSISALEEVVLGGMKQWIQIRGHDSSDPVLLWLHGGPGSAQMPIAHYFNQNLENDFIVVHWDQRGAGKSNPIGFNESTMTFEQYIIDTHELTVYLKEKLHKKKIYLLGHSWGTKIGITMAEVYPEDYYAYIGVSQLVSGGERAQQISYQWLKEKIEDEKPDELSKLDSLGEPPYYDHSKYVEFINLVGSYGGGMDVGMTKLAFVALQAKEYRLSDFKKWLNGANRGSGPMWDTYLSWDVMKEVPEVKIPVYFFSGQNDYNTPLELVKEYFEALKAPEGKQLIIFQKSSHSPFMKEPQKFYEEIKKVKEETLKTSDAKDDMVKVGR